MKIKCQHSPGLAIDLERRQCQVCYRAIIWSFISKQWILSR
jgi:hypothetical protein